MRATVQFEKLCEAEAGGPGANHEDLAAGFRGDAVETVDRAGCGFEDGRLGPGKLREGEELGGREYAVFCEATVHYACGQSASHSLTAHSLQLNQSTQLTMNAMSRIVFAIKRVALLAVIAVPAQLGIVRRHLLPEVQALYICAKRDHDARGFMARDNGHAGAEFTSMDVQVCAADAAGFD